MKIEPLSRRTVDDAINLIVRVFNSRKDDFDYPGKWLPASLERKKNLEIFNSTKCTYLKYYVGIDKNTKKLIGITGLYTQSTDDKECVWIAWYCVNPSYRGKGYGAELLDFTIEKAKEMGKKYLRLYTSFNTDIKRAMDLYKRRGFVLTNKGRHPDSKEELIHMELKLK